jgi:glycosyltransferase involved in cell wall biosynthesis
MPGSSTQFPLVSVCIPTHDDAPVVGDALRSALCQEYPRLEVIVIDNHSTDRTESVVAEIAAGDRRVRFARNSEDIGMVRNFNACIAAATGEYIQILCSDDVLEPGSVGRLSTALREHPGAVLAAAGRIFTDRGLRPKRTVLPWPRQREVAAKALMRECFVHGNLIGEPSAVMFRKSAARRGFNGQYSQAVDLEMWFHLLGQGSAVLLPEALCRIRQHERQVTQTNMKSGRIVEDKRLLFREYADGVKPTLGVWPKLVWDARMASSVVRCRRAGGTPEAREISEIFFPGLFFPFLLPLADAAWKLNAARVSQRL